MIEKLLEIISPDACFVCQAEGSCLCQNCAKTALVSKKPSCILCNKLNNDGRTCSSCYAKSRLRGASVSYRYEGVAKDLIWAMKYQNKRSIARYLATKLMPEDGVVCFVPSDGKARRRRGYDQAEILAKTYAKINNLSFNNLLLRSKHTKQVGKNRQQRIDNIKDNFVAIVDITGLNIILVDDVITTGATVAECSRVLKLAGARSVRAVAVAKG
jgi:ComF family protein